MLVLVFVGGLKPPEIHFVTFDGSEGPHPSTIASADRGDRTVYFQIKALGDYTRRLADRLQPGQAVSVEGPYGRFDIARRNSRAQQIWVAGGIGVTPFLAWLESLQNSPGDVPAADLHYCTRAREADPFIARLESLCASLPGIRLQVHGSRQGGVLPADSMLAARDRSRPTEVWFCGPQGLSKKLRKGLHATLRGKLRFDTDTYADGH